jgi:hypothetical protein
MTRNVEYTEEAMMIQNVIMNGFAINVVLQTAVWAKLACGRENVLLMDALLELLFTKPAVMRMARL